MTIRALAPWMRAFENLRSTETMTLTAFTHLFVRLQFCLYIRIKDIPYASTLAAAPPTPQIGTSQQQERSMKTARMRRRLRRNRQRSGRSGGVAVQHGAVRGSRCVVSLVAVVAVAVFVAAVVVVARCTSCRRPSSVGRPGWCERGSGCTARCCAGLQVCGCGWSPSSCVILGPLWHLFGRPL
jgi:hypothetical protein